MNVITSLSIVPIITANNDNVYIYICLYIPGFCFGKHTDKTCSIPGERSKSRRPLSAWWRKEQGRVALESVDETRTGIVPLVKLIRVLVRPEHGIVSLASTEDRRVNTCRGIFWWSRSRKEWHRYLWVKQEQKRSTLVSVGETRRRKSGLPGTVSTGETMGCCHGAVLLMLCHILRHASGDTLNCDELKGWYFYLFLFFRETLLLALTRVSYSQVSPFRKETDKSASHNLFKSLI